MENLLPISILVNTRMRELGLSRGQLARRTGYTNLGKVLRRLDSLMNGDTLSTSGLIERLPMALGVDLTTIDEAIRETERILAERRLEDARRTETAWRARFKPHAIVVTESSVPEPIFLAALLGPERLLKVEFDTSGPEEAFLDRAVEAVRKHLEPQRGYVPAFGKAIGLILNFHPDRATRYKLDGTFVENLPRAKRIGKASVSFS